MFQQLKSPWLGVKSHYWLFAAFVVIGGMMSLLSILSNEDALHPQGSVKTDAGISMTQVKKILENLKANLLTQPKAYDEWVLLARGYVKVGDTDNAISAFHHAVNIRQDDPEVLAEYADVLAVRNAHSFVGEPTKLLDQALAIDSLHTTSLALAGLAAFDRKDYNKAIELWERLLSTTLDDTPQTRQIRQAIASARQQASLKQ